MAMAIAEGERRCEGECVSARATRFRVIYFRFGARLVPRRRLGAARV